MVEEGTRVGGLYGFRGGGGGLTFLLKQTGGVQTKTGGGPCTLNWA